MESIVTHPLTLMRRTLTEWLTSTDGTPRVVHLRCQECGYMIVVDVALDERGDYFCDGSKQPMYNKHHDDRPSISTVFADMLGERQEYTEEALTALHDIAEGFRDCLDALDEWLGTYKSH